MNWEKLVSDHGEHLYRAAYRVLHVAADSEDVTQDVLLEAYGMYRRDGRIPDPPLLRRMATLRAIDLLRRRHDLQPLESDQLDGREGTASDALEEDDEILRLRSAIAGLPQHESACFALRYIEGMSYREIARALSTTTSSVSTALHRAKQKLRESLGTVVR